MTELEEQYVSSLFNFCYYNAYLATAKILIENGEVVDEKKMQTLLDSITKKKEELLDCKKKLEIGGGLDFTADANYQGFAIRNGLFEGSTDNLYKIVDSFYKKSNYGEKSFLYETSFYIYALGKYTNSEEVLSYFDSSSDASNAA